MLVAEPVPQASALDDRRAIHAGHDARRVFPRHQNSVETNSVAGKNYRFLRMTERCPMYVPVQKMDKAKVGVREVGTVLR